MNKDYFTTIEPGSSLQHFLNNLHFWKKWRPGHTVPSVHTRFSTLDSPRYSSLAAQMDPCKGKKVFFQKINKQNRLDCLKHHNTQMLILISANDNMIIVRSTIGIFYITTSRMRLNSSSICEILCQVIWSTLICILCDCKSILNFFAIEMALALRSLTI